MRETESNLLAAQNDAMKNQSFQSISWYYAGDIACVVYIMTKWNALSHNKRIL